MTETFRKAAEEVKILKQRPNPTELGQLYGLYKQALEGDVNTERPGLLHFIERTKWTEWNNKKGMGQEEAKDEYVALVEELKIKYGMSTGQ